MSHYEIFRECFPGLKLTSDLYKRLAGEERCKSFDLPEGFALVCGNSLRLLCVLPQERGKGAGTRLFRAAADYIRAQGHTRMEVGSPDSELFIGAPEDSCGFFEKLGCTFGEKVAEMSAWKLELPEKPQSGAEFGVYSGDRENKIVTYYLTLMDNPGVLSNVLSTLSRHGANVLTINQNIPIDGAAPVTISFSAGNLRTDGHTLREAIRSLDGVINCRSLSEGT